MQHQRSEELTNSPLNTTAAMNNNIITNSIINNNNNSSDEEIDLDASLSRIGVLSESLSALTRKRPSDAGYTRRSVKRSDSLSSVSTGGHSFGIDELVHNLEGLEFDFFASAGCHNDLTRLGLGDSTRSCNDSTTSRLSTGHWSLQDVEPWACVTCTFENEPVFSVCEMCGQSRVVTTPVVVALRDGSATAAAAAPTRVDESVLARQEQRLYEIRLYNEQAGEQEDSKRTAGGPWQSTSPKPPRGHAHARPKRGSNTRRRGSGFSSVSGNSSSFSGSLSMSSGHSSSRSGHGLNLSGHSREETSMPDVFADMRLHKPRRMDVQDSLSTATTFDMSMASLDHVHLDHGHSERLVYPGILEEDEPEPLPPRSAEC